MPNSEISHLSVLLVDDVRATRMIVRALLHSFGIHDIVEAADGQESLLVLGQRHVDVVITDLVMQPMDGVEFTRRLRTPRNGLNNYVPVLMVSGHTDMAHVREAIAAGVTEFLAKPIVPANLEARLISVVRTPKKSVRTQSYCGPDRRRSPRNPTEHRRRATDKTPVS